MRFGWLPAPRKCKTSRMVDVAYEAPKVEPGWVWLVGTGPGDPGLLTLDAYQAMQQADYLVYDALVGEGVLKLAGAGAVLEYAGKRGGRPSPTQPEHFAPVDSARTSRAPGGTAQRRPTRSCSARRRGSAGIGRGRRSVPHRSGISAGIGGLAYAGIPVTHRDTNSAVAFVTGHASSGEVPDTIDWPSLAKGAPVIVIYMALKTLGDDRRALDGRRACAE